VRLLCVTLAVGPGSLQFEHLRLILGPATPARALFASKPAGAHPEVGVLDVDAVGLGKLLWRLLLLLGRAQTGLGYRIRFAVVDVCPPHRKRFSKQKIAKQNRLVKDYIVYV
jgi:hypothetical protein